MVVPLHLKIGYTRIRDNSEEPRSKLHGFFQGVFQWKTPVTGPAASRYIRCLAPDILQKELLSARSCADEP
jgi:hypothetical protein